MKGVRVKPNVTSSFAFQRLMSQGSHDCDIFLYMYLSNVKQVAVLRGVHCAKDTLTGGYFSATLFANLTNEFTLSF